MPLLARRRVSLPPRRGPADGRAEAAVAKGRLGTGAGGACSGAVPGLPQHPWGCMGTVQGQAGHTEVFSPLFAMGLVQKHRISLRHSGSRRCRCRAGEELHREECEGLEPPGSWQRAGAWAGSPSLPAALPWLLVVRFWWIRRPAGLPLLQLPLPRQPLSLCSSCLSGVTRAPRPGRPHCPLAQELQPCGAGGCHSGCWQRARGAGGHQASRGCRAGWGRRAEPRPSRSLTSMGLDRGSQCFAQRVHPAYPDPLCPCRAGCHGELRHVGRSGAAGAAEQRVALRRPAHPPGPHAQPRAPAQVPPGRVPTQAQRGPCRGLLQ